MKNVIKFRVLSGVGRYVRIFFNIGSRWVNQKAGQRREFFFFYVCFQPSFLFNRQKTVECWYTILLCPINPETLKLFERSSSTNFCYSHSRDSVISWAMLEITWFSLIFEVCEWIPHSVQVKLLGSSFLWYCPFFLFNFPRIEISACFAAYVLFKAKFWCQPTRICVTTTYDRKIVLVVSTTPIIDGFRGKCTYQSEQSKVRRRLDTYLWLYATLN